MAGPHGVQDPNGRAADTSLDETDNSSSEGTTNKPGKRTSTRKARRARPVAERRPPPEGNSISVTPARRATATKTTSAPELAEAGPTEAGDLNATAQGAQQRPGKSGGALDTSTVPAAVRDRFTRDGDQFYFPDGHPAFRDRGRKLTTLSENTEVIRSLVEIAQARGWQDITVAGTERFRREAWQQGRLAGIQVQGYAPTQPEQAALIRAMSRKADEAREGPALEAPAARVDSPESVPESSPATRGEQPRAARDDVVVGTLLDHGRETYRFDPHADMSYFVRVETPEGKRTFWGLDLERALAKSLSQPQIGDEVALRRTGSEPVTVTRQTRSPAGEVVSEEPLATQRHRWRIERTDFFADREAAAQVLRDPSVSAHRATQDRPELAGTYLQLRAAQLASGIFRDPQDRERFVGLVRGALAETVARGDALEPVRLRETSRARQGDPEREPPAVRG